MGKKTQSLKRVWKGPAENRENSGDTVFRGRSTLGSQTEGFGHWHITAQLQQQLLLPSWAEEVLGWPGTAFPTALLLLLPTQGKGRGDTCSQLRGGIRRCSSLWGCSLPWGGRQPISGSENLGRVLFQNKFWNKFKIPFSSLPVRKSQIKLNDTTETLNHMKYLSVRLKSPVMTVKKKYRWVYNIFQTEAKDNYSSSQISPENLHIPQWQQY